MNTDVALDFSALDRLPKDHELPYSDGVPLETPWHRAAIGLLIETLEYHRRGRKDFYCGGDMFLYFSRERVFNKDFRGPDFFVVNGVDHDRPRLSWITWEEGGRLPNVIVELSSPSTADVDAGPKRTLYRDTFHTAEYYIYDPLTGTFDGYQRRDGDVVALDVTADNRVWSRQLDLYLGTWPGRYSEIDGRWVRFFDADGRMVPTAAERAEAEAAARQAAEQRAAAATAARQNAEQRANAEAAARQAAEAEIARLKAELAALRPPQP